MRAALLTLLLALAPSAAGGADAGQDAARSYRIETAGTTVEVEQGGEGKLVVAILPLQGTHVNAEAPLKIALSATPGLKLSRDLLGHKDAQDPAGIVQRFEVPFTATGTGPQEARARVEFFICSEQWCVKQARDVAVAVHVK
ncbi:MAG TPA: hypothetical protein VMU15_21880 [Anaeromyxobacter sp.]|nr:hypothetical protein [Anaeromyxobacter sp.]